MGRKSPKNETVKNRYERELEQPEFRHLLGWDIAPDGERFVIVGRGPGEESQVSVPVPDVRVQFKGTSGSEIRVIVDWFEELRRGPS